jgi:Ca2+-transporting ATPase
VLVLVALLPIVGADVVTEYRGERALEALREASAPTARVRRDGTVTETAASGLVPGDIVLLRAGDVVPADLRLLRVDRLSVDRSVLTGESVPEPATTASDPADTPLASRYGMAYAGTSVVAGREWSSWRSAPSPESVGSPGLGSRERHRSPLRRTRSSRADLPVVAVGLM